MLIATNCITSTVIGDEDYSDHTRIFLATGLYDPVKHFDVMAAKVPGSERTYEETIKTTLKQHKLTNQKLSAAKLLSVFNKENFKKLDTDEIFVIAFIARILIEEQTETSNLIKKIREEILNSTNEIETNVAKSDRCVMTAKHKDTYLFCRCQNSLASGGFLTIWKFSTSIQLTKKN